MKKILSFFLPLIIVTLFFSIAPLSVSHADIKEFTYQCPAGSKEVKNSTFKSDCVSADGTVIGYIDVLGRVIYAPINCSSKDLGVLSAGSCLGRWISSWIGGLLIATASWFLAVFGLLLNYVIDTTVISFDTSIYAKVSSSNALVNLNTIWSFFRDIANIGILGIFSFIAISIIVGRTTFNNKRLVANVLVIALLINFSLLFSQIIIRTSNLFACQFYKAMVAGTVSCNKQEGGAVQYPTEGLLPGNEFAKNGLAGEFLKIIGVKSLSETQGMLASIADKEDNGFAALIHGVFTSLFLVLAIAAFASITILLIARSLVLLLLICIGPLAFAAYLLPAWSDKFKQWWDMLIRQAFFAPILLALLWASSGLAKGITGGTGLIGDALANPSKTANLQAIFLYLFVIGLLFASVYFASKFASSISGMGWSPNFMAGMAGLAALPITGTALGAGALLRNRLGRNAYLEQMSAEDRMAKARQEGDYKGAMKIASRLGGLQKKASSDYNAMNLVDAKTLSKLGLQGKWNGQTNKGGYEGTVKAGAKEAGEGYKAGVITDKDKEKVLKEAQKEHVENKARKEEELATVKETNRLLREKIVSERDTHKQTEVSEKRKEAEAIAEKRRIETTTPVGTPGRTESLTEQENNIRQARARAIEARTLHQSKAAELVQHGKESNETERSIHTELKEINTKLRDAKLEALSKLLDTSKSLVSTMEHKLGTDIGAKTAKETGAKSVAESLKKEVDGIKAERARADRIADDARLRAAARPVTPVVPPRTPPPTP